MTDPADTTDVTDVDYQETAGDPESAVDLPVTAGRDVNSNTPDSVVDDDN